MKLFLLKPVTPWTPWYDKVFGFVVRAETEEEARNLAGKEAGDEYKEYAEPLMENPWSEKTLTTCEELTLEGKSEVILRDFAAA